ncbi:hypothetical protein EV182_006864, partial [Spiromyces aspiralis]
MRTAELNDHQSDQAAYMRLCVFTCASGIDLAVFAACKDRQLVTKVFSGWRRATRLADEAQKFLKSGMAWRCFWKWRQGARWYILAIHFRESYDHRHALGIIDAWRQLGKSVKSRHALAATHHVQQQERWYFQKWRKRYLELTAAEREIKGRQNRALVEKSFRTIRSRYRANKRLRSKLPLVRKHVRQKLHEKRQMLFRAWRSV